MSLANHRPRGVGEILDASFTFYRANFATCLTIAMIVIAPAAVIKAFVPPALLQLVGFIGNLFVFIAQGAIAAMVAASIERGETLDVGTAFRATAGRRGSLIGAQIESGLMVVIGFILLVIPGFIALAWTAVSVPVVVVEGLGYSKAVSRSGALSRGRWGHVLGTLLLSWAIAIVLLVGMSAVAGITGIGTGVVTFVSEILFAFVIPVPSIAMTFLYYDLRVRTESADLDAMVAELPTSTPAV
jgi:hypothetical protein